MIGIAIIEDNPDLRMALVAALAAEPDFEVQAEAASAERALKSFDWPRIDALLLDLDLPGASGIELTAILKVLHPHVAILVNTIYEDRDTVFAALRNGASGYLLKGDRAGDIANALRELLDGGCPISPVIARWIIENFQSTGQSSDAEGESQLTAREVQILQLLGHGHLYKEIADQLTISVHTVHTHIGKIYSKLSANGRAKAIKRAKMLGYI